MRRRDLPRSLHRQAGYIGMGALTPSIFRRRFNLASLFTSGIAQSLWLDRQDLSTIFQDAAGTTVGAVGSPQGLVLDKSKALARGSELLANPGGPFIATTGWTASLAGATVTVAAGNLEVNGSASGGRGIATLATVSGTRYFVTINCVDAGGATTNVRVTELADGSPSAQGLPTVAVSAGSSPLSFVATGATTYLVLGANVSTTSKWASVSVRTISGNHATQGTAPARPDLLQDAAGRYYAGWDGVDGSMSSPTGGGATAGFFFCAAITVLGGAGTPRTIWSDTGTNTGRLVRINAANKFQFIAGNGAAFTLLETVATFAVGETHVVTAWDDGTNMNVQLDRGAVASVARPAVAAGTAGFTIGKSNLSASEFFLGRDYGMVYRGSAPTATEIALAPRALAARAGVTL